MIKKTCIIFFGLAILIYSISLGITQINYDWIFQSDVVEIKKDYAICSSMKIGQKQLIPIFKIKTLKYQYTKLYIGAIELTPYILLEIDAENNYKIHFLSEEDEQEKKEKDFEIIQIIEKNILNQKEKYQNPISPYEEEMIIIIYYINKIRNVQR